MALTPITPVAPEAPRAVSPVDGLRDGSIVEAKVTAALSDTLANLTINGKTLLVTTNKPLPVGAALTLRAERSDGQLRLIVQGAIRDAPRVLIPANAPQRAAAVLAEPVKAALARIHALNVEAALDHAPVAAPPQNFASTSPARAQAAAIVDAELNPNPAAETAQSPNETTAPAAQAQPNPPELLPNTIPAPRIPLPQGLTALIRAQAQTATVQAMFDASSATEPAPGQILPPAMPVEPVAEVTPAHPPGTPRPQGADDTMLSVALAGNGPHAPEGAADQGARVESPEFRQVHVSSGAAGGHGQAERTAAFTVEIPIFLPGNPMPLRLHVTRDEEPAGRESDMPNSSQWTVRFAAEAGPLGMVHSAISLIDGHIGVQLWAERQDTADRFRENAPQLRQALQASDLRLDGVKIAQGAPLAER